MFVAILKREIKLIVNGENRSAAAVTLFTLMLLFCEFALSHNKQNIESYSIISWVCIIFSVQTSIYDLFEKDYEDGTLEQILSMAKFPELVIFYKTLLQWVCTGIPISILSVIMKGILVQQLSMKSGIVMFFITALGTLSLFFISAVSNALTIGKSSAYIVSQIVVLPFFFPTIIYIHYVEKNFQIYGTLDESNFLVGIAIMALIPIENIISFLSLKNAIECS